MYGLHPAQRVAAIPLGGHHASAPGERRVAQSDEAPFARGVPPSPRTTAGRLGHTGESPRAGGNGPVSDFGRGVIEAFPQPASSPECPRSCVPSEVLLRWVLIRFYQACLSPPIPSSCRFYPSCSAYAYEAVEKWGAWRGIRFSAWAGSCGAGRTVDTA